MQLQGWETLIDGTAASGATVTAYLSSGTNLIPPGAAVASTATDAQGYWVLNGLADQAHDVKIVFGAQIKWYKGLSQFSVKSIIGDNYTPQNENLLRNGGFEAWGTSLSVNLGTSPVSVALGGWQASITSGDSGSASQEISIFSGTASKYSLKLAYTKVGTGPLNLKQLLSSELVAQLRGKTVYVSVQLRQGVASNVTAYLNDGVKTSGAASSTTGSFVTLTVTKTISVSATSIEFGLDVAATDVVYVDNVILAISAVAPVYAPRDLDSRQVQSDDLADGSVTSRALASGAVTPSAIRSYFLQGS